MESLDLEPRYSTGQIPGKCIKCLAEKELNNCLVELLREEGEDKKLEQRFEVLLTFLKSPESQRLRDEAEKYLSDGRKVAVRINFTSGGPEYELRID